MWIWTRVIKPFLEWTGHYEAIQAIIHTEVYKHYVGPLVSGLTTAGLGISEGVPLMWVAMATSVVVMAVTSARVRAAEWNERNNPEHKLIVTATPVATELIPVDVPEQVVGEVGNRDARRAGRAAKQIIPAHKLLENEYQPGVDRELRIAQISISVKNTASFPLSVILEFAETEVAGKRPPRSHFPKNPSTIPAGQSVNIADDKINMEGYPCGRLVGKLRMLVKYGRPGKEVFVLDLNADLDIVMENWGMVHQVAAGWHAK
jgi:hypothetical protein